MKNIRKVALKNSARKMFNNLKDKNEKGSVDEEDYLLSCNLLSRWVRNICAVLKLCT